MKRSTLCLAALMAGLSLGATDAPKAATATKQTTPKADTPAKTKGPAMVTTDSGLKYVDTVVGTGA